MSLFRRLFSGGERKPERKSFQIFQGGAGLVLSNNARTEYQNSAVASVMRAIDRGMRKAPIVVLDSNGEPSTDSRAWKLLSKPNPYVMPRALISAIMSSLVITGDAYVVRVSGLAGVEELWPVLPGDMSLMRDGGGIPIYYSYRGRQFPLDKVIHFQDGVHPSDLMRGYSGFAALTDEILTDSESNAYTRSLLSNLGVPGAIISLKDHGDELDEDTAELIKEKFKRATSGRNRGSAIVVTVPVDVSTPGFSPEQMALDTIRRVPERRICSAIGIPPIVAGLGEDPKYDNYRAAVEVFYRSFCMSYWQLMAETLTIGLAGELGGGSVAFDTSGIEELQENADARSKRAVEAYQGDVITRNEARSLVALPPVDGGDAFASQSSTGRASAINNLRARSQKSIESS